MRRTTRSIALVVLLTACVVADVDLEGKACPCAPGWTCDEPSQICVRDDDGEQAGAFEVVSFAADWSTPHAIHWTWEVVGDAADFHAWEVHLAASAEALDAGTDVIVVDGTTNPELDRFFLRNTESDEPVVGTVTRDLEPEREYFARLHVLDTAGGRSTSANVAVRATTAAPIDGVAIFADDEPFPPGYALPVCYARSDATPHSGTHHYELVHGCTAGGDPSCTHDDPGATVECWENLRWQDMAIDLGPDFAASEFNDAYIEMWVAIDVSAVTSGAAGHGWWAQLRLRAADTLWSYDPLTLPADGAYHRHELPLAQVGLDHATLGGVVQGLDVGSEWAHGTVIRVDEAWIRW